MAIGAFSDVDSGHENYDAINYLKDSGIVQGYSDNTFRPDNTINRAEFTKIIIEATFDDNEIESCIGNVTENVTDFIYYNDVNKDEWYAKYICTATVNKIVNGYNDGTFKPANEINFAEAAKIIATSFELIESTRGDPWYAPYVKTLELRKASPSSITKLDKYITRGEMAEMIWRILEDIQDEPSTCFETECPASQTYHNDVLGYEISYPADFVEITDDNPECVTFHYEDGGLELGYLTIGKITDSTPYCGRTGFGYDTTEISQNITIEGQNYTMEGHKEFAPSEPNETLVLWLGGQFTGTRIEISSTEENYDDYLDIKPELVKMVESYKSL